MEIITGLGCSVQTENKYRFGWTSLFDALTTFIEHSFDTPKIRTGNHDVSHFQGTVLDQHGGHITTALVQRRFNHITNSFPVWIGLEFKQISFQQDFFQQFVDVQPLFGRNILRLVFATPIFHQEVHLSQCFLDFLRIGTGFVHLVDGKYDGYIGSRSVVDGLNGLRHHIVIGSYNDDGDISDTGSTGTHGSKRLVTRSIQECYFASTGHFNIIGTNVLGNTSSLTSNNVGLAYVVEQRRFTMVDVTHHGNNRWTGYQFVFAVFFHVDGFHHLGTDIVGLETKFIGDKVDGLCIQTLVD